MAETYAQPKTQYIPEKKDRLTSAGGGRSPIYTELHRLQSHLGRYQDAQEISTGSMKSVKKVFDTATAKHVAYAELKEEYDKTHFEDFLREARLNALLEHPNIMSIHDIGLKSNGRPYFTMDLKPGISLAHILSELETGNTDYAKRYPMAKRLSIFHNMLDAVAYAHSQGIIHLDLKPGNIQVGQFGETLVCDWGLAEFLPEKSDTENKLNQVNATRTNERAHTHLQGTPGYMSPEQATPKSFKDERSDIYALGAILFHLCTLEVSVKGDVRAVLEMTKSGSIKSIEKYRHIPGSLRAIIKQAMALNPDQRYPDVKALQEDLNRHLSGLPTEAENPGTLKRLSLYLKRHQRTAVISLMAFWIIAIISVGFNIHLNDQNIKLASQKQELEHTIRVSEELKKREAEAKMEAEQERARQFATQKDLEDQYWRESLFAYKHLVNEKPIQAIHTAIASLEKLLALNPNHDRAQSQLTICYFVSQQFDKVHERRQSDLYQDLYNHAYMYKDQRESNGLLNTVTFCDLITQLSERGYRDHMVQRMLAYHYAHNGSVAPVIAVLKIWNPTWQGEAQWIIRNRRLKLAGKGLKILNSNLLGPKKISSSPLAAIDINRLDLCNSEVTNLNQIKMLDVIHLDIRETQVENLSALRQFPALTRLIITSDQFKQETLSKVPRYLRVIERKGEIVLPGLFEMPLAQEALNPSLSLDAQPEVTIKASD